MCHALADVRRSLSELSASFEASILTRGDLAAVLDDAGVIEKTASALAALAAAGLARSGPKAAARQVARDLAQASGSSIGEASRALVAAGQIDSQPELEAAARAGALSRQQLCLVADAVSANPGAAAELVDLARTASLSELADSCARAKAAQLDLEERARQVHAARSLRSWTDGSGTWHLHAQGTPEAGAQIMAAIQPHSVKAFDAARKQGRRERPEAYNFDALLALSTSGGGGLPPAEVLVRVDQAALLRGYTVDGEVCELAGVGPISPKAVIDMMETGDPFLKALLTKGKDVAGVAHLGRRPNAHQQTALDWLFPTCAAESCGTRARFLQTDHRVEWARSHVTILELLDRLCRLHHALKTNQGWALVEGKGKRPFVPPADPRHPRHAR